MGFLVLAVSIILGAMSATGASAADPASPHRATAMADASERIQLIAATSTSVPPAAGFVTRSGSRLLLRGNTFRFAGTNEYYLGLDDNIRDAAGNPTHPPTARIDDALQSAVRTGATVVRSHTLGISVGCAACFEPRPGVFSPAALASADYAIYRAGRLGLKLMIPLTDQWRWYHGGQSTFTGWAGYPNDPNPSVNAAVSTAQRASESHFYTDPAVIAAFRLYVSALLNHVNPYNGIRYKDDPTVMAWETGNELWTANPTWTQDFAAYLKHTVGVRQLVADGSAADGMPITAAAVRAPDIDIVGGHFYPVDVGVLRRDAAVAASYGKAYVIGEFDWTNPSATAALISAVENDPNISGDLYWTLLPRLADGTPEPHDDGFAMYSPAVNSSSAAISALLTAHARRMALMR
jgi:mannan endo-1,4-beta-mannosidase